MQKLFYEDYFQSYFKLFKKFCIEDKTNNVIKYLISNIAISTIVSNQQVII